VAFLVVLLAGILTGCASAPASPRGAAEALLERGRAAIARGDMVAATSALREALRLAPDLVEARAGLGFALYAMGDVDGAVDELRARVDPSPDAGPARQALASALVARRDWETAGRELEQLLRTRPDPLQAHYTLGIVRYALGDLGGAVDAYRRVLAGDPANQEARYNLALVLKLLHRDAEAMPELLTAAGAGHGRAQYFAGAAYATGAGVARDLTAAIGWWFRAADQGVSAAAESLAQLRRVARGQERRPAAERLAVEQAFRDYRAGLWKDFPDLAADGDETVGGALLRRGRVQEAVPVLIREASALSEPAQRLLETLYERGVDGQLPVHDARILGYLEAAAAEDARPRHP
jgi:tetratricopeptide (TPR) repeat protein